MAFGNLARAFLDLVFGRNVGTGGPTASSARDAILNNKPLPVASIANGKTPMGNIIGPNGLPIANRTDIPAGKDEYYAGRWMADGQAAPIGAWVRFTSTWIYKARFDYYPNEEARTDIPANSKKGDMYVQFLSFAMVRYRNVPAGIWGLLYGAPSHGKWLYNAVIRRRDPWSQGYDLVMPPSRKVTLAIRQANG